MLRFIDSIFVFGVFFAILASTALAQSDPASPPPTVSISVSTPLIKGVPITPIRLNAKAPSLHTYLRFQSLDMTDRPSLKRALKQSDDFQKLSGSSFNMGPETRHLMVVITASNAGPETGEWLLTTNRGALRDFALDEWDGRELTRHIDGQNLEQVKRIIQTYHAFTHNFSLAPGEVRTFVVSFDPVHSSLLPLEITSREAMASSQFAKLAVTVGSAVGMLVIVVISISIYSANGRPQFLWMGLAELAHALFVVHVAGYTTFYILYATGNWVNAIGFMLPQLYAVAMAQFARSFINTKEDLVWLDRILRGLIYAGCFLIAVQFIKNYFGDPVYLVIFDILAGVTTMIIVVILPYVAVVATRKLGSYHWPLIVAWGSLCLFVLYGTFVSLGILKSAPYNWLWSGPVGLFQTIFAFWALVLYLNKLNQERLSNALHLSESLIAQQNFSEQASKLTLENEDALSTIRDQENLIHASGHDSQHVLMALKTIIKFADKLGPDRLQANLPEMLRSSAGHLENIIGSTLSNPVAGFQSANFVALSTFSANELLRSMETIYGPMMRKEQMKLRLNSKNDFMLVSDRALLARILSNLLSNCLKFAKDSEVTVSTISENNQLHIVVTDGGAGMPEEIVIRFYEPTAMRMKPSNPTIGTGFGLLSSKRIATILGGRLEIEKSNNDGTVMRIILPHLEKESSSQQMTMEKIESLLPSYRLIDIDAFDDMGANIDEDLHDVIACNLPILPMTYDSSSQMASRISKFADLVLIKPVTPPMVNHPILSEISQIEGDDQSECVDGKMAREDEI